MKIKIENDEGVVLKEFDYTDSSLETRVNALEESETSVTQKALAYMRFTEEITKRVDDAVSEYINSLMGWAD